MTDVSILATQIISITYPSISLYGRGLLSPPPPPLPDDAAYGYGVDVWAAGLVTLSMLGGIGVDGEPVQSVIRLCSVRWR